MFSTVISTKWSLFQHSVQRAVTGCAWSLSVFISDQDWNLSKSLPNKPGSSNSCLRGCQSPGNVTGSKPWHQEFVQPSGQGRAAQLSTAPWRHCYPLSQSIPLWNYIFRWTQGHFLLLQSWIAGVHREYIDFYLDSQLIWSGCPYCR